MNGGEAFWWAFASGIIAGWVGRSVLLYLRTCDRQDGWAQNIADRRRNTH